MKITEEITKEVFENYVPAARMPERNGSVYNRLQQQLSDVYTMLVRKVVGEVYEERLTSDRQLKDAVLRHVCLQAFVMTARSLDLVLTATGFGIVSTNSTAPASKSRVDALIEECRIQSIVSLHDIILHMTSAEGWGGTPCAETSICCLFWNVGHLTSYTTLQLTSDNWQKASGQALEADVTLRKAISDEYMEELLRKIRTHSLNNDDTIIVNKCLVFIGGFISRYDTDRRPASKELDAIVGQLETYVQHYPTYQQSATYRGRHAERYKNKKDDPTFFFM